MELVLATKNTGKIKEIKELLNDLNLIIYLLNDFSNIPKIIEDGKTYQENAIKKAKIITQVTNKITLADDSGIEVDVLDGRPGIYSARFAGTNATDRENNQKLLNELRGVPFEKRTCRYKCVVAIATPNFKIYTTSGSCEGIVAEEERGSFGFGYDPIFYLPKYNLTMAQLPPDEKNRISHRAKAVLAAKEILKIIAQSDCSL